MGPRLKEKTLSRREREKLRQRRDMLTAALRLFSEKGYHSVSMHEIAEESEFAIGTLYKFFRNKEDLYRVLVLEQADAIHDALVGALEEPRDEIEKLRNYIRVKSEFFRDNVSMIRLYFGITQGGSFNLMTGLDAEMRRRYDVFLRILASTFEKGILRKRFRKVADPYHLALALESQVNAFLFLWVYNPERHPAPVVPETVLKIFFDGLVEW